MIFVKVIVIGLYTIEFADLFGIFISAFTGFDSYQSIGIERIIGTISYKLIYFIPSEVHAPVPKYPYLSTDFFTF